MIIPPNTLNINHLFICYSFKYLKTLNKYLKKYKNILIDRKFFDLQICKFFRFADANLKFFFTHVVTQKSVTNCLDIL